jgi:hypothetical protein
MLLLDALQLLEEQKLENQQLQQQQQQQQQSPHTCIGSDFSYIEEQATSDFSNIEAQETATQVSMSEHLRVNQELLEQMRLNQELLERLWKYEKPVEQFPAAQHSETLPTPAPASSGGQNNSVSGNLLHQHHNACVMSPSSRVPCRPASVHTYSYSQPQQTQRVFMPEIHAAADAEFESQMSSSRTSPRKPPATPVWMILCLLVFVCALVRMCACIRSRACSCRLARHAQCRDRGPWGFLLCLLTYIPLWECSPRMH